jgi:hypothetical protein
MATWQCATIHDAWGSSTGNFPDGGALYWKAVRRNNADRRASV